MLKYTKVIFDQSGNSRLIAEIEPEEGWVQAYDIPETVIPTSITVLKFNADWSITKKYLESTLLPNRSKILTVEHNNNVYTGKLLKQTEDSIFLNQNDNNFLQITRPYVLSYDTSISNSNEINNTGLYTVDLFFHKLKSNPSKFVDITLTATGFNWNASYKIAINFKTNKITYFQCDVQITNDTNLALTDVMVELVSKSEIEYNSRPRAMATFRSTKSSQNVESEQTNIGTTIFKFKDQETISDKMISIIPLVKLEKQETIDCEIKLMFEISPNNKHPSTYAMFKVPNKFEDGIPYGPIECWDSETNDWLANTSIPMTGPNEKIILNLGENGLVNIDVDMQSNRIKEEQSPKDSVEINEANNNDNNDNNDINVIEDRTKYKVKVSIRNNSKKNILIYPYHPYYQKVTMIKFSTQYLFEKSKVIFQLPIIKSMQKTEFNYELIA